MSQANRRHPRNGSAKQAKMNSGKRPDSKNSQSHPQANNRMADTVVEAKAAPVAKLQQPREPQAEGGNLTSTIEGGVRDCDQSAEALHEKQAMRLRLSAVDPASVMLTSFLLLVGLGSCALASVATIWMLINVLSPQGWPALAEAAVLAIGIVTLQTVVGTVISTSAAYLYNISSERTGGLEMLVEDDAESDPLPDNFQFAKGVFGKILSAQFEAAHRKAIGAESVSNR
ncbi:hypothetical protein ACWF95_40640 [Streptomyces vinaceus]